MLAESILTAGVCLLAAGSAQLTGAWSRYRHVIGRRSALEQSREEIATALAERIATAAEPLARKRGGWTGWREMTVFRIVQESSDCKSFYLRDPDRAPLPTFQPGQFLTVGLRNQDGSTASRCYSLSAAPDSRHYRITVKRVPNGGFSPRLHDTVNEGDVLLARAPAGKFVSSDDASVPLNLLAAGIGITPMISIAKHYQVWQPQRVVQLFYQIRDLDQAPLLEEAARWAAASDRVRLYLYLSKPGSLVPNWIAGVGRLDAGEVVRRCWLAGGDSAGALIDRSQFLICGPPIMVEQMQQGLVQAGIDEQRVIVEAFGGPAAPSSPLSASSAGEGRAGEAQAHASESLGVPVEFKKSGKTVTCDTKNPTILEAAESVGIAMDSGCRAGDCGACITRLLKGEVSYASPPGHGPLDQNEVLACVARPTCPTVVDA